MEESKNLEIKKKSKSKAELDNKIRAELISEFEKYMANKYGKCIKVIPYEDSTSAHNFSLASPTTDETGRTVWVKVDVAIPRGNRSTNVYDGDEMASRYQQNVEQYKVKTETRAKEKAKKAIARKKSKSETASIPVYSASVDGHLADGYVGTTNWN